MGRILIVDDDDSVRTIMGQIVVSKGHTVSMCRSVAEAIELLNADAIDVVVSDVRMEPQSGMALLQHVRRVQPGIPVIMMTAYASVETALDALKIGAYDYLTKPFKVVDFIDVVEKALACGGTSNSDGTADAPDGEAYCFGRVVGVSEAMRDVGRLLELVSATDATVLLRGEPGTGRSLLAREIHANGLRADQECVWIRAESLNGGSASGEDASADAPFSSLADVGKRFVEAGGGSVILEGVERLMPPAQRFLLQWLREKTVPVKAGADDLVQADVRLVVTAGPELLTEVGGGRFDRDLYKRLGLLSVEIAPLSERTDDILPLFWHFLRQQTGASGEPMPQVTGDVRGALQHYLWPGNVKEVEEVAMHCYRNRADGMIVRASLPERLLSSLSGGADSGEVREGRKDRASSLRAFLRQKGVEVTDEMLAGS